MKKAISLFGLLLVQLSVCIELDASAGKPAKAAGDNAIPCVVAFDSPYSLTSELNQLIGALESNNPSADKKISKELDTIAARIEARVSKAPNVVEKNKILTRFYVSCTLLIGKIECIEKSGFITFNQSKKKLEILKLRLFIQIERLCKIISFDIALQKAEENGINIDLISDVLAKFLEYQKLLQEIENNEDADFIQRKKEIKLIQDKISNFIIECLNEFFFHTNRSIPLISLNTHTDFIYSSNSTKAGWSYLKNNIEIFAKQLAGKNEFFVQSVLNELPIQEIEKLKRQIRDFICNIEQLFKKIEKNVENDNSYNTQTFELWHQITLRIFAQLQKFISMDIWPPDLIPQVLIEGIKQIKERIIALINNKLELCAIIKGVQDLDTQLPPNEKIALLLKLHQIAMKSDRTSNNDAKLTKEQQEHLVKTLCKNSAMLIIKYLNGLLLSTVKFQPSNHFFTQDIENPLWHLLELLCTNKSNGKKWSKEERDEITYYYTKLKRKLMRVVLHIQQQIKKQIADGVITPHSHENSIDQIHSLYMFIEKINKKFYEIDLDKRLIDMKPCLDALAQRPFSLIDQVIKEKSESEEQIRKAIKALKSDLCEENYYTLAQKIHLLNRKIDLVEQVTRVLQLEFKHKALIALSTNFHRLLQKHLIEIHDFNAQAIARTAFDFADSGLWVEGLSSMQKLLIFIKQNNKTFIKSFFAHLNVAKEKNKTIELFTQVKNALFLFIVGFEQEIKNDINNSAIEASVINVKINHLQGAINAYEKLHEILFESAQYDKKIDLSHRITHLQKRLRETSNGKV